jgi:hypothetical protein
MNGGLNIQDFRVPITVCKTCRWIPLASKSVFKSDSYSSQQSYKKFSDSQISIFLRTNHSEEMGSLQPILTLNSSLKKEKKLNVTTPKT